VVRFDARGISAHVNFLRQGPFSDIANHTRDRSGRERINLVRGSGSLLHFFGGAVFLEFGEQPVAIAIKKSRQQKRNGQTRFIEASLFLLS